MTIHELRTRIGEDGKVDFEREPTKQDGLGAFRGVISLLVLLPFLLGTAFVSGVFLKALVTFFGWGWGLV